MTFSYVMNNNNQDKACPRSTALKKAWIICQDLNHNLAQLRAWPPDRLSFLRGDGMDRSG